MAQLAWVSDSWDTPTPCQLASAPKHHLGMLLHPLTKARLQPAACQTAAQPPPPWFSACLSMPPAELPLTPFLFLLFLLSFSVQLKWPFLGAIPLLGAGWGSPTVPSSLKSSDSAFAFVSMHFKPCP